MGERPDNAAHSSEDLADGSDFTRPRGIYTKQQIEGYKLMCAGAVSDRFAAGIVNVHEEKKVRIVSYDRHECNCGAFMHSHPRVACRHLWAVYYTVEPPAEEEVKDLELRLSGQVLPTIQEQERIDRPETPTAATTADLEKANERFVRGGYKRFAREYDSAIRDMFGKEMRFALRLFEEIETNYTWKPKKERGRRQVRLSRLLFAAYAYTYLGFSVRATEGFMKFLASLGFFGTCPRPDCVPDACPRQDCPRRQIVLFGTLSAFLRSPQATALINELLAITAEPFRDLGPMTLVGDGTGIAADRNKFFDYRMQRTENKKQLRPGRPWFKAVAVGSVDTLHTVLVRVVNKNVSEHAVLKKMLDELAKRDYDVEQLLYDGGVNDTKIRDDIIEKLHALPLIPWAKNSRNAVPKNWRAVIRNSAIITQLHRLCMQDPAKFKQAGFRFRVKGECLFSQVKELFGAYVRTIDGNGPENEIMLKFLAYNMRMVIMASNIYGLNIDPIVQPIAA